MPMYFPDLKSVQGCVDAMRMNKGEKCYNGIYPENEEQLAQARTELATYFRTVWKDELQAMEIEMAVTEENYERKMRGAVLIKMIGDG